MLERIPALGHAFGRKGMLTSSLTSLPPRSAVRRYSQTSSLLDWVSDSPGLKDAVDDQVPGESLIASPSSGANGFFT